MGPIEKMIIAQAIDIIMQSTRKEIRSNADHNGNINVFQMLVNLKELEKQLEVLVDK